MTLIVWSSTYTVRENVVVPSTGEYMTIDFSDNFEEIVSNKCYNWLPWTFGILCISTFIGIFLIAVGLKTSWKKAIGYSILVNIPSVIIGVLLYLIL